MVKWPSLAGQGQKKEAGPSAHPLRDEWKAPLLSSRTVNDVGAVAGIDPHVLRHYCLVKAVLIRVMIRAARASICQRFGELNERWFLRLRLPQTFMGRGFGSNCLGADGLI